MNEIFEAIAEPLQTSATVKSIFGEPVAANGKTIIPVARVAYGFGGGSGKGNQSERAGEGSGGGGGVVALPVGVYEITDTGSRFVAPNDRRKLFVAAMAGVVIGALLRKRRANKT